MAQNACISCNPVDRVITAAIAQNSGFNSTGSRDSLTLAAQNANGGGIGWSSYISLNYPSPGNAIVQGRQKLAGVSNFWYLVILKYALDLHELHQRGAPLPYGITESELAKVIEFSKTSGKVNPHDEKE